MSQSAIILVARWLS